jgi:hypothetical protein
METTIQNPLQAAILIDRCLELEKEYDSIQSIHLTSENIEDVDSVYQEKLEQGWYKAELEDEYRTLNDQLGYTKRNLYDKSSRRSGM